MINYRVRRYLIDNARGGKPVFYSSVVKDCQMGLNLNDPAELKELRSTLANISIFEHENMRPLISSLAVYKPTEKRPESEHGDGFYRLCERLGYGNRHELKASMYGFEQINLCRDYWDDPAHFLEYYILPEERLAATHQQSFFTIDEIQFLHTWGNKVYDKTNNEHVAAKNYIMQTLGSKTVYWSNQVVEKAPGLEAFNWRMWNMKGWDGEGTDRKRVARFKPYTWARIYRKGDENKDIFFTVGVDGEKLELVYKLEYYYESNSFLSPEQKKIIEAYIPKELRWVAIPINRLDNFNWERLINESVEFIKKALPDYDKLISMVWKSDSIDISAPFGLQYMGFPDNGFSSIPAYLPGFEGSEIDYIAQHVEDIELGGAGEQLVIRYERYQLRQKGLFELADRVVKVKDGKGYDILSFEENGNERYIEVKTTAAAKNTPFYYSLPEFLFARKFADQYCIYRLYDYDEVTDSGSFYKINNNTSQLLMQAINFKVYPKNN